MAHKRDYKPEDIAFPEQHIVSSELVSEMEKSYIESVSYTHLDVYKRQKLPLKFSTSKILDFQGFR